MSGRPRTITIIGWLFVVVGIVSLSRQFVTFADGRPALAAALPRHFWYAAVSAAVATLSGAFILRGANWARWLLATWLVFHVVLGMGHGPLTLAVHTALAAVVLWLLYRRPARAWFRPLSERPG
jgi:hypothetical protein